LYAILISATQTVWLSLSVFVCVVVLASDLKNAACKLFFFC